MAFRSAVVPIIPRLLKPGPMLFSVGRRGDYRAAPITSARAPATRGAGMLATAALWVGEGVAEAVAALKGVEAGLVAATMLELGVTVYEFTRTRVLVMVVVATEVVFCAPTT